MDLVVDSSAIASVLLPEKHSLFVRQSLEKVENLHTLDLASYEVSNTIRKAVLRGGVKEEDAMTVFRLFLDFLSSFKVHGWREVVEEAYWSSLKYGITVYNASFLALARRINSKFLTLDVKLMSGLKGSPYSSLIYPLPEP